jgi:hypothetical protein
MEKMSQPDPSLPEPRPSAARAADRGRVQRELTALLADIAAVRSELGRQAESLRALYHRLDAELRPWETKLAAARRETLRILGGQYRAGWLPRRDADRLREALRSLADELEAGYGLDLSGERREFLDQIVLTPAEAAARAQAERESREGRLEALRKAIGNEDGPREGAAREKRVRMDALRKALRGEPGGGAGGEAEGDAEGGADESGAEAEGERKSGDGSRKKGARPKGEGGPHAGARQSARSGQARVEEEAAFGGDIRALYLLLARALHPDKESDPGRREAKTAWMQKVTAAYGARDLAKLLDILAQDPLGSVGPYLSAAPLAAVNGFAKRLRRELAGLRAKAETGRNGVHVSLRRFLGSQGINEPEVKRYAAELKKEVRFVKERNQWYRERTAVEEMLRAMGGDWRGYM